MKVPEGNNDDGISLAGSNDDPRASEVVLRRGTRAAEQLDASGYFPAPAIGWSEPWLRFCIRLTEIDIRLVGLPKSKFGGLRATVIPVELASAMRDRIYRLQQKLEWTTLERCEDCGRSPADGVQVGADLSVEYVSTRCTLHPVEGASA
ncbi:MAG: hypothetical protein H7288_07475 [Kineosporiaceae bacterium]|nr:hypothetical protein [Aeromicrobium sp.]